jgi:predicted N-acetyltransferase YhbS
MATIVAEKPEHVAAIERVLDRAFGPGRFAKTSERVRERGARLEPALSRVALDDAGEVIGVCRIWRVKAGVELFFLGPLAVDPAAQASGLGLTLTREAVTACRVSGGLGVVLIGAERFFRPLGIYSRAEGPPRASGPGRSAALPMAGAAARRTGCRARGNDVSCRNSWSAGRFMGYV